MSTAMTVALVIAVLAGAAGLGYFIGWCILKVWP